MLIFYRENYFSKNCLDMSEIALYIKGLSDKRRPDEFYTGWIQRLNYLQKNCSCSVRCCAGSFNKQVIKLSEKCAFRLNYSVDKISDLSRYNSCRSLCVNELCGMGVVTPKKDSGDRDEDTSADDCEDPVIVAAMCPFGTKLRPVAMIGGQYLSCPMIRNMRIDCILLPNDQTALSLSDPFERAWYTFIDEYNRYIGLDCAWERRAFVERSALNFR